MFSALGAGASALALICASQAVAQEAPTQIDTQDQELNNGATEEGVAADEEVVITGIRQSLASAQTIKRNADTVVDAITAEDIGALPDRSINEALQRVPGVAITRFAGPTDSAHFSVEGSGVQVRGLNYTRSEFNGRDSFAVSAGRGIGFNDIPVELAGSVEVFKNLTADLIEGGIAGTVNINTRKPFDVDKEVVFLSGALSYGDMTQRSAPSFAGLYSNQWDVGDGGRFGALIGASYFKQYSRSDSVFLGAYLPRFNAPSDGVDGYAPDGVDYQGSQYDGVLCDGNNPNEGRLLNEGTPYQIRTCDAFPVPEGFDTVYTPLGAGVRQQDFATKRNSITAALQYETGDRSLMVTAQYLRAESVVRWIDRSIETNGYYNDIGQTFPAGYFAGDGFPNDPNANFTFDDDGIFTGGTIVRIGNRQAHNTPNDPCIIPNNGSPYESTYCDYTNFVNPAGLNTTITNRAFYQKTQTQDASLNVKWAPTDRLRFNFDGQYAKSTGKNVDDIVSLATFTALDVDLTGGTPQIGFVTPGFDPTDYFQSGNSAFYNSAMNNRADNDGEEWAFRADAEYDLSDEGFLRKLRAGGRYAKREQTVRTNDYNNWGSLSATWTDRGPTYINAVPGTTESYIYDDFFRRGSSTVPAALYIKEDILRDHDALMDLVRQTKDTTPGSGFSFVPLEDRGGDLINGYFLPSEIYDNEETTWAAYARADFGHDFANDMRLSGNIGVRYVRTIDKANGAINFPNPTQVIPAEYNGDFGAYCAFVTRPNPNTGEQPSQSQIPALCRTGVTAEQQQTAIAFANGASVPDVSNQKLNHWLPSLNLRFDVNDKLLFRFAASRAISRPDFASLRNYVSLSFNNSNGTFEARSSNPYLKPIRADQFDVTAEWYFADVGQLTLTGFYKELKDVIIDNSGFTRNFANNGVDYDLQLTGPANADGKSTVKGLELAYQQTYDFLPGALSGLGAQASFTYIKAGEVQISSPDFRPTGDATPNEGDGYQPVVEVTGLYDSLPLPQLSKYNYNLSVFYDKYGLQARLAYSWRSKYLLNNRDCCFPFLPVYAKATGTLDGSIFVTVNEQFKVGVQVINLLDETTKTTYLLNGDGLEAPRSYFKTDRQISATARITL